MSSPTFTVKSKAVRAGAGAGKTYNLTHTVLDFVSDYYRHHQKWPHVMVTTFTIKATQELSERLIKLALEEKPELVDYVSSPGYLTVSTIHGILDKFLKKHGHLMGLGSDFTYFRNSEISFQAKKLLKKLIENSPAHQKLLSLFSFSALQRLIMNAVYTHLDGHEVLSKKHLSDLLREDLSVQKKKLDTLLNNLNGHQLNERWEEARQALTGISGILIYEKWEMHYPLFIDTIATVNLRSLSAGKTIVREMHYDELKEVVEELRTFKETPYDPSTFDHISSAHKAFDALKTEFEKEFLDLKKSLNKIELQDLENFSLSLIRSHPECARQYAASKDFWLIDEFQDTSPVQVEILNALVGSKPSYVVGDPQQSIYLFRGARTEVFHDKVQKVKSSGGEEQFLTTNYRSTEPLLEFMNKLSENLGSSFQSMSSAFATEEGQKDCAHICVVKHEDPKKNGELEEQKLAEYILKLHNEGVSFADMAVLLRDHKQIEKVAARLMALNVPVFVHSSGSFWQRREVIDALSLLKFFVNPHDDLNLIRLLRSPFIAVSEQNLADLMQARTGSAWGAAKESLKQGAWGSSGQKLLQLFEQKDIYGLRATFVKAMESLGLLDLHLKYDPIGRAEGNLWKFVHLLKTFEAERGANYAQFINDAERDADSAVEAPGSVNTSTVNLMTVHGSKGLQFEYVFLPFLGVSPHRETWLEFMVDEEKQIWGVRSTAAEGELKSSGTLFEKRIIAEQNRRSEEEDLRVFYVAYTRAKKFLYMSWSAPPKKRSWAEKIQLDITPGRHEADKFSYTVEESAAVPVFAENIKAMVAKEEVLPPYSFTRKDYYTKDLHDHVSVTEMVTGGQFASYQKSFVKKRQGILFHRLLELLRYPENTNFREIIPSWFPEDQEEVSGALQYILSSENPPYVEIIRQGAVEWPFVLNYKGERIEGQIDLWGIVDGQLWVVDYKSGEKVLQEKAFHQLMLYATALRGYLKWDKPIHLAVVYPFIKEEFIQVLA